MEKIRFNENTFPTEVTRHQACLIPGQEFPDLRVKIFTNQWKSDTHRHIPRIYWWLPCKQIRK